jgi:peptidoglycan hydrolase CwlO-like protein
MNLFKDSIDEVQYRRPPLYRNQTLRHRAVSDQSNDFQFNSPYSFSNRRSTNDLMITNIKNQVKELDTKVSQLTNKVDEIIKCITSLRRELKK